MAFNGYDNVNTMHLNSLWQTAVKELNIFMTTVGQPVPLLKLFSNSSEFPLNY